FPDGQIDAPAVPPVVLLDGQGNEVGAYDTLAAAIAEAEAGYCIEIDDGADLAEEGTVIVTVNNLTIAGAADVTVTGLELGANVHSLRLEGEFSTRVQGNALDNVIVGNAGANYILGGAGNDLLV